MNRYVSLLLTLSMSMIAIGCSGPKYLTYDPVRDEMKSECKIALKEVLGFHSGDEYAENTLTLKLEGKGKSPKEWKAHLDLWIDRVPDSKKVLGENAKVEIGHLTEIETPVIRTSSFESIHNEIINLSTNLYSLRDPGIKDITIDDFVTLTEDNAKFKINGQDIPLTKQDREKIRQMIIEAREAGYSAN